MLRLRSERRLIIFICRCLSDIFDIADAAEPRPIRRHLRLLPLIAACAPFRDADALRRRAAADAAIIYDICQLLKAIDTLRRCHARLQYAVHWFHHFDTPTSFFASFHAIFSPFFSPAFITYVVTALLLSAIEPRQVPFIIYATLRLIEAY